MILMIDNYDSFTYNLVRYFKELGEDIEVCMNDEINLNEIDRKKYLGIVISPGPKSPEDAGMCLKVIDRFKGIVPILGICLGHQCIGEYFGGSIQKGVSPFHGKVSRINHNSQGIFENIKNPLNVTRYHSLVLAKENLNEDLEVIAKTEDNVIMGIQHKCYPIYGLQFHPEAELTEEGHKLLGNFINMCKRFKGDGF